MGDQEYRDELLAASYEAVKLELENTETDLEQLKQRAEKLRAAVGALAELLPERAREQTRGQVGAVPRVPEMYKCANCQRTLEVARSDGHPFSDTPDDQIHRVTEPNVLPFGLLCSTCGHYTLVDPR